MAGKECAIDQSVADERSHLVSPRLRKSEANFEETVMRRRHLTSILIVLLASLIGVDYQKLNAQQKTDEISLKIPEDRVGEIVKSWGLTLSDDNRYVVDAKGRLVGGRVQELDRNAGIYVAEPAHTPNVR